MDLPKNLKYTKDHEWVENTSSTETTIGVSEYAIEQLGDIVHIELPDEGSVFNIGDSFGTIESTKTVSDLYMPVGGTITAVNDSVIENPQALQDEPYGDGWLVKIKVTETDDDLLLDSNGYEQFIKED